MSKQRYLVLLPVAVVIALVLQAAAVRASGGEARVGSEHVLVGESGAVSVEGRGYADCANETVVISFLFREVHGGSYGSWADARRLSTQQVTLDADGDFAAELPYPADVPSSVGVVAMESDCITLAPVGRSFLARVYAVRQEDGTKLVIPAEEVATLPVLPGSAITDRYQKLDPIEVLADGKVCATHRTAAGDSGDIVIDVSGCPLGEVQARVGEQGSVLVRPATLRQGYVVPMPLVFPPPHTGDGSGGDAPTPGAPDTGTGAGSGDGNSYGRAALAVGLAVAGGLGIGAAARRTR